MSILFKTEVIDGVRSYSSFEDIEDCRLLTTILELNVLKGRFTTNVKFEVNFAWGEKRAEQQFKILSIF